MGALADVSNGAVLVLGTGIGGGIVLNKQVWMGCSGGAGELSWFISNFDGARDLKERDWVKVTANVGKEFFEPYGREGVVLSITQAEKTKEPKNAVIDFSQPA